MNALHAAVRLALRAQLLTVSSLPAARAWPNEDFTAPVKTRWVRETFQPVGAEVYGLPVWNAIQRLEGLYYASLFEPAGNGSEGVDAVAGAICVAFPAGLQLQAFDGATVPQRIAIVTVRSSSPVPAISEPNWYQVPVRIRWTADAANPLTPPY